MTRWLRSLTLALLAVAMLAVGSFAWRARAGATAFRVVRTADGSYQWQPGSVLWVLLIGEDLRTDAAGKTDGCGCTDAIHLIAVPPGGGRATMLNIPRDVWVNQPGGANRVNVAYQRGGARNAANVIGSLVGVTIPYVVVTNFPGLIAMVDELGGITVNVQKAFSDSLFHLSLPVGPVHMDGAIALTYARSRHGYPDGDLSRTAAQANLILAALADLRGRGTDPRALFQYLPVLLRHVKTDGLGTTEMVRLGRVALSVDPNNVRTVTMPADGAVINGAAVLLVNRAAQSLFADLRDDGILETH
jgi:LCP family protein required for cell wall assembly